MFKSLILAVVLLFVSVSAGAATYGIMGGMVVSGPSIGTPVVIQFDGRELFLSEADCNTALQKVLRAPVTRASANTSGDFSATEVWAKTNPVTKTSAAVCVKTTQF